MAAVCAGSVEPLPVVLAEPAVVAGTISVELMGFAAASVELVVEELAVAVASAGELVDVESGVLVRLAVLVEPEVGSGERVEAPVPSVVVGLAAPAEVGTELLEFAVELSAVVEPAAGLELTAPAVSVELVALVEPEATVEFAIALAALAVELVVPVASGAAAFPVPVELVTEPVGFVVPAVGLVVLAVPTPVVLAVPVVPAEPDAAAVAPYMPGSFPSGAETVSWATVGLEPSFEYARM